jgi:fatty acid desaturase
MEVMLRHHNRAVVFFMCLGLIMVGITSGIRLLVLLSFPAVLLFNDRVATDLAKVRLGAFAKGLAWIATLTAVSGTSVLFLKPSLLERHLLAVQVITPLCWAVFFGVVVVGLLAVRQSENASRSRESETPTSAEPTAVPHKR